MAETDPKPVQIRPGSPAAPDDASSRALSEALGSSFFLIKILGVVLVVAVIFSCKFTVNPNQQAIVLRLGKPLGAGRDMIKTNGLHFRLPAPIDEVVFVPVGETRFVRATNGWYAVASDGDPPQAVSQLNPAIDGHVITSDGNIMHVRATLRYRIADPIAYTFAFKGVTNLIANSLNDAVQWASVRFRADDMIYKDTAGFRNAVRDRVAQLADEAKFGIVVDGVEVERTAPGYVKTFFDQVQSAEQDRSKRVNEAQGEADRITREAEGEANRIVASGKAAAESLIQGVAADARFFQDQLPIYRENPGLYRRLRLIEVMSEILTNSSAKFFLPKRADGQPRELRLTLNPEPEAPPEKAPGAR